MDGHGVVLAIHLVKAHGKPPEAADEARALVGHGLEGDVHGKGRPHTLRQVLLADRRALEAFGFRYGALREQITLDFAGLDELPAGTRLRVGQAVLELTGPCEPCEHIGQLNAVGDPAVLRDRLIGRRGMLAKVVEVEGEGRIRRGDAVASQTGPGVPSPAP